MGRRKRAVDELTINHIVDEMTVDDLTVDELTLDDLTWYRLTASYSSNLVCFSSQGNCICTPKYPERLPYALLSQAV